MMFTMTSCARNIRFWEGVSDADSPALTRDPRQQVCGYIMRRQRMFGRKRIRVTVHAQLRLRRLIAMPGNRRQ
jgi:hypothetical protein